MEYRAESPGSGRAACFHVSGLLVLNYVTSHRKLFPWRITMLLAANAAVIFFSGLVQLEVAVCGKGFAALSSACICLGAIGLNPRTIVKFWCRTSSESMR
jgi:hypothetical protein